MEKIDQKDQGKIVKWLDNYIEKAAVKFYPEISTYVAKLRDQNNGISPRDLAKKIVSRKSFKNGLVGSATGIPGVLALPVTIPTDLIVT